MDPKRYLAETSLLDFNHPSFNRLVNARDWNFADRYTTIGAVYSFVKDEITFGYNEADNIPASQVLEDGYGQCNTKSTLLMAMLRKCDVPCRIHAFAIDRRVQKGAVPEILYALTPQTLLHTWVEVEHEGKWLDLEGCILDPEYLAGVQVMHGNDCRSVCGYGVAVQDIRNPPVEWQGASTHIQKEAIVEDYGTFDSPDDLYRVRGANLGNSLAKNLLFKYFIRKIMNARVGRIRKQRVSQPDTSGQLTGFGVRKQGSG